MSEENVIQWNSITCPGSVRANIQIQGLATTEADIGLSWFVFLFICFIRFCVFFLKSYDFWDIMKDMSIAPAHNFRFYFVRCALWYLNFLLIFKFAISTLICSEVSCIWASLVAQKVKNPPVMQATWVWSLDL